MESEEPSISIGDAARGHSGRHGPLDTSVSVADQSSTTLNSDEERIERALLEAAREAESPAYREKIVLLAELMDIVRALIASRCDQLHVAQLHAYFCMVLGDSFRTPVRIIDCINSLDRARVKLLSGVSTRVALALEDELTCFLQAHRFLDQEPDQVGGVDHRNLAALLRLVPPEQRQRINTIFHFPGNGVIDATRVGNLDVGVDGHPVRIPRGLSIPELRIHLLHAVAPGKQAVSVPNGVSIEKVRLAPQDYRIILGTSGSFGPDLPSVRPEDVPLVGKLRWLVNKGRLGVIEVINPGENEAIVLDL